MLHTNEEIQIKRLHVKIRRVNTYKKLLDYAQSRGGAEMATIITDIVELAASGELVYKNGKGFFER